MKKSKVVDNFLDFTPCEDFLADSFSVPCLADTRRNSNASSETSSSYMSESNEPLGDYCCPSPTCSECDSLSLSEIVHVSILGAPGVGKRALLHHFTDTQDMWSDLIGNFYLKEISSVSDYVNSNANNQHCGILITKCIF
jgi:hypothetical protein